MKNYYLLILLLFAAPIANAQWGSSIAFQGDERDGSFSFVINGKAYVGGGLFSNDLYEFNESSLSWTKKNNIANDSIRVFSTAFVADGKAYIVGGDFNFGDVMDEVWCYDPTNDSWTQKNNYPGGNRIGLVAMVIGSRVFVGGGTNSLGQTGYGTVYDDFYEYTPATDTWTPLTPSLPDRLAFASSFVIGNKGYVVFGNNGAAQRKLHIFDPATMSWSAGADYPVSPRDAGVAFAINGKGYAGLGQSGFNSTFTNLFEYDPAGNKWTVKTDYPAQESAWSTAFVLGNKAYAGTGLDPGAFSFSKEFFAFTPSSSTGTSEWQKAGVTIYPNPCNKTIHIDGLVDAETDITLTNAIGQSVVFNRGSDKTIDISHLEGGIYFITVGGLAPVKVVKY